ncbi:MAG: Arm DNA-binding domain-containing protein [Sphingomonas sp.]
MTLTHIQITHAKPASRAYKLADSDALYLVVNPSGAKLWRMNYRFLGRQPAIDVADEGLHEAVNDIRSPKVGSFQFWS